MSDINKNGGPAFPVLAYGYTAGGDISTNPAPKMYEGMSLRDWFAGMALQALKPIEYVEGIGFANDARCAYALADAILAEREKVKCTCGEPHISDRIIHCYDGKPCHVKE